MSYKNLLKKFWRDDSGQSTTEYILILSVVVMIAIKFKSRFSSLMGNAVDRLGQNLDNALQETN